MAKKSKHERHGGSIENSSIMRKFTVLFLVISVIPTVVLFYFYTQVKSTGQLQITESEFNLALTFIVLGVLLGYATLRSILIQVIEITRKQSKVLHQVLPSDQIKKIEQEQNEITALAQSFNAITSRLEENVRSLELTKKTLHSVMSKVGHGISSMQNIDAFLDLIVETVTEALQGSVGVLMLYNENTGLLSIKSVYGTNFNANPKNRYIPLENSSLYSVLKSKKPIIMPKLPVLNKEAQDAQNLFEAPMVCTPLIMQDKVRGLVSVSGRQIENNFTEDDMTLLYNIASQTAVAIENSKLSEDIEKTYFETISALALAVDAKDKYSRGHLDRVSNYCVMIANKLGLEEQDIITLREAARLHDLGKIGIPDEVLQKPGPLNDQEWILMKKHPEIGESIIKPIRSLRHLCDIIRHHHEKLDGSGYPDQIKGDEISPLVRILTVSDIYDALTTDRSYRNKYSYGEACRILREMKDQLDQDIVEALIEMLEETTHA
ncbi:MAG: HD domain-containing protein [Candidatus Omnitrophica bacterium]|nr:HD domain-containing protein [Candidatus Omnitrophota bacterium]